MKKGIPNRCARAVTTAPTPNSNKLSDGVEQTSKTDFNWISSN